MYDLTNWARATPHQQLRRELTDTLNSNRASLGETLALSELRTPSWLRGHIFSIEVDEDAEDAAQSINCRGPQQQLLLVKSDSYIQRPATSASSSRRGHHTTQGRWSDRFHLDTLPRYHTCSDPYASKNTRIRAERAKRRDQIVWKQENKARQLAMREKAADTKRKCVKYMNHIKAKRVEEWKRKQEAGNAPTSYAEMLLKKAQEDEDPDDFVAAPVVENTKPRGLVYGQFINRSRKAAIAGLRSRSDS